MEYSSLRIRTKLHIFQSVFVPALIYGLDSFTLTTPQITRIDAYYIKFLCRIVGIKAFYYSRIPNTEVYNRGARPKLPSEFISVAQFKMMYEVFTFPRREVHHSVVFSSAHTNRMLHQCRPRGMQFPYWLEVMSKQYFPATFALDQHALGPRHKYALMTHSPKAERPCCSWEDAKALRLAGMALAKNTRKLNTRKR